MRDKIFRFPVDVKPDVVPLTAESIPRVYTHAYQDTVNRYTIIRQPFSKIGPVVLHPDASYLYSLIDNTRTLKDIHALAVKLWKNTTLAETVSRFEELQRTGIVYFSPLRTVPLAPVKELAVWMHLTNACNLRCTYCFVNKTKERMDTQLAIRATTNIIRSAKRHGVDEIRLKFAGGEPLLEIPKLLTCARNAQALGKQFNVHIRTLINTNGTLITERVAQLLKQHNIDVVLSLDGLGPYHDHDRVFPDGSGSFRLVERGMEHLLSARVRFWVLTVITAKSAAGIPNLVEYLLQRNIFFILNLFNDTPYARPGLRCDEKTIISVLKKSCNLVYRYAPPGIFPHNRINKIFSRYIPRPYSCIHGSFTVRHDGKLASHPMTLNESIGSIDDPDIIGTVVKANLERVKNFGEATYTRCLSCNLRYLCCNWCPLMYRDKAEQRTQPAYCNVYQEIIPYLIELEAKRLLRQNGGKPFFLLANKE